MKCVKEINTGFVSEGFQGRGKPVEICSPAGSSVFSH